MSHFGTEKKTVQTGLKSLIRGREEADMKYHQSCAFCSSLKLLFAL